MQENTQTHFGSLRIMREDIPLALKKRLQETGKTMEELMGRQPCVYDFGFFDCVKEEGGDVKRTPNLLKSGDMLTMFNTIVDGQICLEATMLRESEHNPNQPPKGIFRFDWADLLQNRKPVKLETENNIYYGTIAPLRHFDYFHWTLRTFDFPSKQIMFGDGDKLTAYDYVTDGQADFEGRLSFSPAKYEAMNFAGGRVSQVFKREVQHGSHLFWTLYCEQNRPVKVERKKAALKLL
jgi:hypothetical protein